MADHFERVRAADPCDLVPHRSLKKYGPEQLTVRGSGMTECQYLTGYSDPAKSVYSFKIDLHGSFSARDAEDATEERLGGRKIYREEYSTDQESHRSCHYKVPYEGVEGSALALDVVQTPPRGLERRPWPQRCTAAKEYLAKVMDGALGLPPRRGRAVGVLGKDPCARKDALVKALGSAYRPTDTAYSGPYACDLTLENRSKNQKLTVAVSFAFHVRQRPGSQSRQFKSKQTTIDGLYAVRSTKELGLTRTCADAVELRRATNSRKNDAHYVSVHLSSAKLELKDEDDDFGAPPVSCAVTDELTKIVLAGVR
ncbi:hypothetical protein AB0I81_59710 [Nonomuraea sp. NPDC050404]|uniref:hypothetical protein n=1 Tax=Nonomuraea sp. NPDC050404 TaxID=3155783 RepID=UPI0033E3B9BC